MKCGLFVSRWRYAVIEYGCTVHGVDRHEEWAFTNQSNIPNAILLTHRTQFDCTCQPGLLLASQLVQFDHGRNTKRLSVYHCEEGRAL